MKRNYSTLFGLLLIFAGVLMGLQQYNLLGGEWSDAIFVGLWALGALYFYDVYRRDQAQWWFGLVALVMAGMALSNALDLFIAPVGEAIGGAIFFGAIGTGFLLVYRRSQTNWWALIPAGVMFSLAAVTVVDELPLGSGFESGSVLFIGIGLTFLIISQLKVGKEDLSWAIYPAIPLLALGALVGFGEASAWNYVWPGLIILLGVYFLVNALRKA